MQSAFSASPANRQALLTLATIAHDRMVVAGVQNRFAESLAQARNAADRLDRFVAGGDMQPHDQREAAFMYGNIAVTYDDQHEPEEAVRYARRAAELSGPASGQRSLALGVLAVSLREMGDLDGALRAIRESRTIEEQVSARQPWLGGNLSLALWREGSILGEDGEINLNRPAEAVPVLQRALEVAAQLAKADPHDNQRRQLSVEIGRRLADIVSRDDPRRAMAIYDDALSSIRHIENSNVSTRRSEALLLASSSYALRRLHRDVEARQRIDGALELLRQTRDYPAQSIALGSEADLVLRALGAQHAETGHLPDAIAPAPGAHG